MSFALLGFKWGSSVEGTSSGTVTWSADYVTSLGHSGSHTDADFDVALNAAFEAWEMVASIDFVQVASGGDIQIGASDLSGDVVGTFFPTGYVPRDGYDQITSADINFDSSDRTWAPTGGDGINFYAVALHEIGHAIGLGHPVPNDLSEIMNEFIAADDLGDGDMRGAQQIYGTDEGDVVVPEEPTPDAGGGGGGGGGIIGLLAIVLGLIFGGGVGGVALAAGRIHSKDDDTNDGDELTLSDVVPITEILPEHDHDHEHPWEHVHETTDFLL